MPTLFEPIVDMLAGQPLFMMVGLLLLMMAIKVPIAVAMGMASIAYLLVTGANLRLVAQTTISNLNSFTLLAIPFFVLAGELMNASGVSERLIGLAQVFVCLLYTSPSPRD